MSQFTHFLEIFEQKKCLFGSKTVFLGQEVHYYMVYIAYFTELNLQICDFAQKRRICRENCKYALDENFHGHFCPRRKAAKFCHPVPKHFTLYACFHFTFVLIDSYIYNDYSFDDSIHRFYPNFKMQSRKSMQCWIRGIFFTSYWHFWYFGCDFQGKYCDSGVVPHFVFINSTCQYKYCWISWISENHQTSYSGSIFSYFS